ncbi:MAG: DNA alkylation repair protein [Bacteroidetes bacterium]|nr:DNA alkylation repair protein [Bacteroidota bacterium]MDA1224865.1 DNA alkylation repair protein [Bacteroidota bacterium]
MTHPWVQAVQTAFSGADNPRIAAPMSAYMKNLFPFHGITSQHRAELLKDLLAKENLPQHNDLPLICRQLWQLPQREYTYAALTLMAKFHKKLTPTDIPWIIDLVTQKSWWDSVDTLAGNVLSTVVNRLPDTLWPHFEPLISADNFWLNRTAIIVQLKLRDKTDTDFLTAAILPHMHNKEFFLRKAIGWSLCQYARTNPQWVIDFVNRYDNHLSGLSKREALKHL